ncbi:zinc-dependent metalloprotease family protein [Nocardioides xinjiangensis]|uniref:zinc-dependent metalloprotease family protein n=1 Tax=Nocardioides xinjiangensis TaxID=2817376 RepID=UPI0024A6DA0C|nr:M12 family metallo-peptidase [Nocardioides sp. SYSU D00778]
MLRSCSALLVLAAVVSVVVTAAPPVSAGQASQPRGGAAGCSTDAFAEPVRASKVRHADLAAVRERNDLTATGLSTVVADPRAWVDRCGAVFYTEPARGHDEHAGEGAPSSAAPATAGAAVPSDVLDLSSLPGSARTIYLDFTGDTTTGTAWNQTYGTTITSPAYSLNAPVDARFDDAERAAIHLAWRTVAEDFAAFDVNVTTREPDPAAIVRSSPSDTTYGTRVVITPTNAVRERCSCGGVAYIDVFDSVGGGYYQPAWVFTDGTGLNGYNVAQAISHEVGHNFGLHHDGTSNSAYYAGANGWAPLMGASYNKRLSQWSNGRYAGATNKEDDIAIVAGAAPLRVDDHGATSAGATRLVADVPVGGIIGSRTDVDAFAFVASGATQLSVAGGQGVSDSDIALTVLDEAGARVATVNPTSDTANDASLHATWNVTLPDTPRTYVALVDGTGFGDPLAPGGYDDYGSLGAYQVVLHASSDTTQPEPTPTPTPVPTPVPTPGPTPGAAPTGSATSVSTTVVARPPTFTTDPRLPRATRKERYRGVIEFTGTAVTARIRGLAPGLEARRRGGRIVVVGAARRRGRFDVQVTLVGSDVSTRRTFRLRVC